VSVPALDLATSATIVWRHKFVAATLIILGLAGNTAYTLAQPEAYTSSAYIMLPATANLKDQVIVATSVPVLADALSTGHLGLSLETLRNRVTAAAENAPKISITGEGPTADQAEQTANAVTRSYLSYVTSTRNPAGPQAVTLLQLASTTKAKPLTTRVYQAAGIGLLGGALVALIAILAIWRGDRRLRTRDAIADSMWVPVLASVQARGPHKKAGWTALLREYAPGAVDAWQLDRVLRGLGVPPEAGWSGSRSVAVLSVSGDRDALALGPQLAAFATAQGISAALTVGRIPEPKAATALQVANQACTDDKPAPAVTVIVDGDAEAPQAAAGTRGEVAVVAVTAGVVTADRLARVVAGAARSGLRLAGAVVINPCPSDLTTGRLPQLARSGQQGMPTRMTSVATGRGK